MSELFKYKRIPQPVHAPADSGGGNETRANLISEPGDDVLERADDAHIRGEPPVIEIEDAQKNVIARVPYSKDAAELYLFPFRDGISGANLVAYRQSKKAEFRAQSARSLTRRQSKELQETPRMVAERTLTEQFGNPIEISPDESSARAWYSEREQVMRVIGKRGEILIVAPNGIHNFGLRNNALRMRWLGPGLGWEPVVPLESREELSSASESSFELPTETHTVVPHEEPVQDDGTNSDVPQKKQRRKKLSFKAKKVVDAKEREPLIFSNISEQAASLPAPTKPTQIERGLEETPPESWESYGRQHRESIEQQRQERVIEHENEGHDSGAEVRDELPRFIRNENEIERPAPERDLRDFYAEKPRKSWFGRMWDRIIGRDDTTEVPDSLKRWASGEPLTGVEKLDSQKARAARRAILAARRLGISESSYHVDGMAQERLMKGQRWAGWRNSARIALTVAMVTAAATSAGVAAPIAVGLISGTMRAVTSYKQNHSWQEAAKRGLHAGLFAGVTSLVASNLISHFVAEYGSSAGAQHASALADTDSQWARFNDAVPVAETTQSVTDAAMRAPVEAVERGTLPNIPAPTPDVVADPAIRSFTVESGSLAANSGLDGFVASSQEMQQVVQNLSERSQLQFTDALRRTLTSAPNIAEQFVGAPDRIIENASGKDLIFKAGDVLDVDMLEDSDFRKMLADTIIKHERILTRELGGADAVRKLLRIS